MKEKKKDRSSVTLHDLIVLSLLSENSMHGYQLVAELEKRDVQDWANISRPQVYYSINKLFEKKLISKSKDSETSLGPDRTKYVINDKGSSTLNQGLSDEVWATQRPPPPFLTWMALSAHLPRNSAKKVVERRREFLLEQISRERKTLSDFDSATDAMAPAGRLMVTLTIQMFELELKWLDTVKSAFV